MKAFLPNLAAKTKLFLRALGKSALDELKRFFQGLGWSYKQMKVVGHDDELMQQILVLIPVVEQYIQQQVSHSAALEETLSLTGC